MNLRGNTILITGGASGIGLALARRLITNGNTVIVCGRDQAKLDAASRTVPSLVTIRTDIADPASRQALVAELTTRFPGLNVLINNAGIVNVSEVTDGDFVEKLQSEIAINLVGPISLIHQFLPLLKRQAQATIANITTGYVFVTGARTPHYSATKTALHSMTQSLRYQLKGTNVRVLEIMPPPVDTNMASHYIGSKAPVEPVAGIFLRALLGNRDEVTIGISNVGRILGRIAPSAAFALLNDGEARAARSAKTP